MPKKCELIGKTFLALLYLYLALSFISPPSSLIPHLPGTLENKSLACPGRVPDCQLGPEWKLPCTSHYCWPSSGPKLKFEVNLKECLATPAIASF